MSVINTSQIDAMVAQLRTTAARAQGGVSPFQEEQKTEKTDFASALKSSLDQVNSSMIQSEELGQRFVAGDNSVSLSDVMISVQKANIGFQTTVQVRNKLVSAYQDIMNMQV